MKDTSSKIGKVNLGSASDTASYALGVNIASAVKSQGFDDLNIQALSRAFQDVYGDHKTLISLEETDMILQSYFGSLSDRKGQENLDAGRKFLEENAGKKGVITTSSGLQYEVIKEGSGAKPADSSMVKVHYHGTLIDGTVFDSSVDRGEPVEFPLNGVIRGWTEGVQLMTIGSKYKFYIPSELGYGSRVPQGGPIEPNSVLIFEVELLDIIK